MTEVLDHGYIELIECWGSDESIIEAARMSTSKGFLGWDGVGGNDEKLLRYLWEHNHLSPFEMAGAVLEVQAPIFVLREWMRHRTQSYNELSARYTTLPDLFYLPSVQRLKGGKQSKTNKQGSEGGFTEEDALANQQRIAAAFEEARSRYERLLELGVSREIARIVVPVAQYSRMRVSSNLRNWMQFLALRLPSNAQWEIRQYAKEIENELSKLFPRTLDLFREGRTDG